MKRKISYLLLVVIMIHSIFLQSITVSAAGLSEEREISEEVTEEMDGAETNIEDTKDESKEETDGEEEQKKESPEEEGSEEEATEADTEEQEKEDPVEEADPEISEDETLGNNVSENLKVESEQQEIAEECVGVNAGPVYQEGAFDVTDHEEDFSSGSDGLMQAIDWNKIDAYLYHQFKDRKNTISLTEYSIPSSYAGTLVSSVVNEHPDLYAVDVLNTYTYYSYNGYCVEIQANYLEGYDDTAFDNAVNEALGSIDDSMNDVQKAITLHDYLVLNCEYYTDSQSFPNTVYDAYAVLVNRKAVCQGYALAYKYLLNQVGIDCYMVTSEAMNHAWNLIGLNGKYYQVDVTWDDPLQDRLGYARHKYMFVSDEAFRSSREHYQWVVTYGNQEVNLVASDTTYDNAFWVNTNSPLVIKDDNIYYINHATKRIMKRAYSSGEESTLYTISDMWRPSDSLNSYYTSSYSGLFRLGDRLYFNTPDYISSITFEGTDERQETEKLSGADGSVYGSIYRGGLIYYVLYTQYQYTKETPRSAQLLNEYETPASKITISPTEVSLGIGESIQLETKVIPASAAGHSIEWKTSDEKVASVENGLVRAIGRGTCIISASVDGRTASCEVTVRHKTENPVFTPEEGTIDRGELVSITSETGADIYYTIDGSIPALKGNKSTKKYENPFSITKDTVIKAVAILENEDPSEVVTANYVACTNELRLDAESLSMLEGEQKEIAVKELPTLRIEKDVVWNTDMPQVAQVDQNGTVTAVREGTATITAQVNDHKGRLVTAQVLVTVEAPVYTVRFIGDQKAEPISIQKIKARRDAVAPLEDSFQVPLGYIFKGWKENYTNIQQDIDIHAEYEAVVYKIAYFLNGGTAKEEYPEEYTVESATMELGTPVRNGFRFIGWYEDENLTGNSISFIESGSVGDKTLYAKWKDERGLWFRAEGASEDNVIPAQPYTGKAVKPVINIYYGSELLNPKTDYSLVYQNNTNVYSNNKKPTIQITGKGNFAGKLICNFEIAPKNLEDEDIIIDNLSAMYNKGKYIKALPQVYWNGKKLSNNKDYTVEYPDQGEGAYADPGDYTIIIKAKSGSNYIGERHISFHITDPVEERLFSKVTIGKIADQKYRGQRIELTEDQLKLTFKKEVLKLGEGYEIIYSEQDDYTEIGTHEILIRGKGIYCGERRVKFKVVGQSMKGWKVTVPELIYNGEYQTPKIVVTGVKNGPVPEEGKDFVVSYEKNLNAGTAKIVVTGIGSYTGTITKNCRIKSCNITDNSDFIIEFVNGEKSHCYQKDGTKPEVVVSYKGQVLKEGTDYSLSYVNNKSESSGAKKKPMITVTGKNNFNGKRMVEFAIQRQNLEEMEMTAPDMVENKSGGKFFSTPTLTDLNGKKLQKGKDYESQFVYEDQNGTILGKKDCPKAGSVIRVTVRGKGNYEGTCSTTFRIIARNMNVSSAKVTYNRKFNYTGDPIHLKKEDITVKMGKNVLTADQFEIMENTYVNNIKKGTAKVTIRGKGEYGGTKVISFSITSQNMEWWK